MRNIDSEEGLSWEVSQILQKQRMLCIWTINPLLRHCTQYGKSVGSITALCHCPADAFAT